jgi:serine/threonine protein kinase
MVHRDLKSGNIMLTKTGTEPMDFGLAKPTSLGAAGSGSAPLLSAARTMSGPMPVSPLTTAGSIVGTIQYMSLEQIEGKDADARSDIFAFGAVLYEMAMGWPAAFCRLLENSIARPGDFHELQPHSNPPTCRVR